MGPESTEWFGPGQPLGRSGPPNSSLLWTVPEPVPALYRQALGQPGPQPLTSIGQTPQFYFRVTKVRSEHTHPSPLES